MSSSPEAEPAAPESPFSAVPSELRTAMERRGFASLTTVQVAVLDSMREAPEGKGRDLQISSQTGSGKTVALGFALAPSLIKESADRVGPTTLVIAPTRELAAQIKDELQWLFADVRHVAFDCVTGGTSQQQERNRLRRRPAILVGTPGRLLDHITSGALKLGSVTQLVLDEADQMLDLGFRDELEAILGQVPKERSTHLVSATFPAAVRGLTKRYQKDALHIEGTELGKANADIEHVAHLLNARDRYGALVNHLLLAGVDARVLVFVRTREDTTSLADQLETDGFRAMPLSGELTQAQRTRTLAAFRRGAITTLVATDVAARGLDVPDVQSVVHMDPPVDSAAYTHRSGRTGRAGQKGTSVLLVSRSLERVARRLIGQAGVPLQWRPVPTVGQVRAARDERLLEKLMQGLTAEAEAPAKEQLELAKRLLADHDPARVVATLVAQLSGGPVCEPFDLAAVHAYVPPTRERLAAERAQIDRSSPAARSAGGSRSAGGPPAGPVGRPETRPLKHESEDGFVSFRINWGSADGADPRRILAHVCRRGEVESRMVGAISIKRSESTFGIVAAAAAAFSRRVQRRDSRDPHLEIHAASEPHAKFQKRAPRKPASATRERTRHGHA